MELGEDGLHKKAGQAKGKDWACVSNESKASQKPKCFLCKEVLNIGDDKEGICMTKNCPRNKLLIMRDFR